MKKFHHINTIENFGPYFEIINNTLYFTIENRLYSLNDKFEKELIEEFPYHVFLQSAGSNFLRLRGGYFDFISINDNGFDIFESKFNMMSIIHNESVFFICTHFIDKKVYISKVSVNGFVYWTIPTEGKGFIKFLKVNDDCFTISMMRHCSTVSAYRFEDGAKIWETDLLEIDPIIKIDEFSSYSCVLFDNKIFIQFGSPYSNWLVSLDLESGKPTIIDRLIGTLKVFNNRLYIKPSILNLYEISEGAPYYKTYDFSNLSQKERVVPNMNRFDFYKNDTSQYFVFVNGESFRSNQVGFVDLEKNELTYFDRTSKRNRNENCLMTIKVHDKYVYLINFALSLLIFQIED